MQRQVDACLSGAEKGQGALEERTEDGGSYTNIFFQMENIERVEQWTEISRCPHAL